MNPLPPRRPAAIDVLIPAHNAQRTVLASIDSILQQSLRDIRVLVVDDGSSDQTISLLRQMASDDDRVIIFERPHSGIVEALNFGLSQCTAEYVARHDADDLADPHRLQTQLDYLASHPTCVAVSSGCRTIDEQDRLIESATRLAPLDLADPEHIPSREPYLIHPFLMVRRTALAAIGGYRFVHHSEDTDLYWRLMSQGSLHIIPDVLGSYRRHAASISNTSIANGRLSALYSQLAAVSEVRRRRGQPDLIFEKSTLAQFSKIKTLQELVGAGGTHLRDDERVYLALAVCAKMLELSWYRLWRLPSGDISFIRRTLTVIDGHIDAENHKMLQTHMVEFSLASLRKKRLSDALSMLPPKLYVRFAGDIIGIALRKATKYRRGAKKTSAMICL